MSISGNTLVEQRDKLAKTLEAAFKQRELIKKILSDPEEIDKYLKDRVSAIKEKMTMLDIGDQEFARTYCSMQAKVAELNALRADLHMPENNCKEIQARIAELESAINDKNKLGKREKY